MLKIISLLLVLSAVNGNVLRDDNGPACTEEERYDCGGQIGLTVDSKDCHVFYNCNKEIQSPCPSHCPDGLGFDETIGLCNWENQVAACGTRDARNAVTEGPACETDERYDCEGRYGRFVDTDDCHVFYNCDSNIQAPCPSTCPPGLAFDESLQVCNWESQVGACNTPAAFNAVTEGPACETDERYDCEGRYGRFVDTDDCHVFYNCDSNIQAPCPSTCPPGLAFDESLQVCNWESQVGACNTPAVFNAVTEGPACETDERYDCEGRYGRFVDTDDCHVFYNCDSNIQAPCPSTCPPGLAFDESLQVCNWESQVGACNTPAAFNAVTEGPACETDERYDCEGRYGRFVDTDDCHVFYNCDSNIQAPCPSTCPPGLAFDESLQVCNWESQVGACNTPAVFNAVTEGPACETDERYDCEGRYGRFVDTDDCHVFYNCDSNIQAPCPSTCPPGLAFDESLQVCNWESQVGACNTPAAFNAVTEGPACETDERYDCEGRYGRFVDTDDCHVFYNCDSNIQAPCPSTCPPGLAFDESLQVCNWESQVGACNTPAVFNAVTEGPACETDERYDCEGRYGRFVDTDDCHVFYNCDSNIQAPCPSTCPPGLAFDESLQVCNWESQVGACNTPAAFNAVTEGPACETDERYDCEGRYGRFVDTDDCHVFYNCDSNIQAPCPSTCPPGLAFDESLQVCNWESQVGACNTP